MDNYDLKPEPKVKRKSPIWNILTVLVLLSTCGVLYYFFTIFTNPYSRLNLFPPVPLPTKLLTASPTSTYIPLEPTWTSTATIQPSPSRTKAPTWTLLPELVTPLFTYTPTEKPNSGTETITPTPMPATAEITYMDSTTIHPDLACDWMGVGGKVVDMEGKPVVFQTVQLSGTLNGKPVNQMVLSGHDANAAYGSSGFEFTLGTKPVATTQELWIMLFDNTGQPLTSKIYLDTFTECDKNLIMVVFTKNR